ncbi:hypothetical protein [Chryseobacterium culicis]|uniref:hypothetical protein n=1 Tax=Chryseobacterium culicis TaxID=680127 RepID=UPI001874629E|nr:hypothetical protein [Chryseobacterium culicis]MBE4949930.1 hypothetical protein [Chryseobacterium culicis]
MKQLELIANKRLLIVETTAVDLAASMLIGDFFPEYELELICKGSDLTEDIAKGFIHQSIHTGLFAHYVKKIPVNTYCHKTALEAFDTVISAYGYHWGENPVKFKENEMNWEKRHKNRIEWERAESRTFTPEKCIIFEIV